MGSPGPCFCLSITIFFSHVLLFSPLVSSSHHLPGGNPANDIVAIINKNRTAAKLEALHDSPGLGCMALQYVELCKDNCSASNGTVNCNPPEDDFTEVFGPNCGVELPTFGTITGHIVGCSQSSKKYIADPEAVLSEVLVRDGRSLSVLRNRSHKGVGVGLFGVHDNKGRRAFFWCVLFSDGETNSTFVLEEHGVGMKQKKGCFSGSAFPCNSSSCVRRSCFGLWLVSLLLCLILLV